MEARPRAAPVERAFALSLRIRHPSIDPAEISAQLQLAADHSFKAGDPRHSRSGIAPATVHSETYWLGALDPALWPAEISFAGQPASDRPRRNVAGAAADVLDLALSACCTRFLARHADFLKRIRDDGGQVSLLVELFPEVRNFSVTPELGGSLSQLGVRIEFDLNGASD